ncbi:MAG TPA: DUF4364 family protein [Candidatus Blautia intestinipullorum]|nr:DUF4364 family protein [Candidatus Blautia intestinipullorum]
MSDVFTLYKLIVLYMAQQSREELTNSQISQFVLDRDYTDYFHLQQVLSELVETGLLKKRTVSNSSHYEITEEGSKTLFYFEKDLSSEIKKEVEEFLKDCGVQAEQRIQTPADYFETPQGGYAVRCQYIEKDTTILDLTLSAPNLEAARAICRNWPKKSPDIYAAVMGELI